ncbi:hypothetical protein DFH01_13800 [Falsiroseomonas bella]|uniref:Uncharacterized protein n=2 Tax=Falsiroseomonas bella TaxID=2184016 RepID=A0A317FB12_9PROT|nr:hypothetical protein DFH01_13800 [Falsiroseomonas bella]
MIILAAMLLALAGGIAIWFGPWTPLGALIFELYPPFLNTLQAGVQRRIAPELWDLVFLPVLTAPAWVIPFVLGDLLLVIGILRRRRRRHG